MAEKKTPKEAATVPGLRITAKKDGFRRAGREWRGTSEIAVSALDERQIEQLKAEAALRVEDIEIVAEEKAD